LPVIGVPGFFIIDLVAIYFFDSIELFFTPSSGDEKFNTISSASL